MKKFYKENRVFVILMGIALVCIAIILWMVAGYVFNSSAGNKYGNRLDGINDVKIEDAKIDEMESSILEMNKVQDIGINIHGKIVNFNITVVEDATVEEAQNVSISCSDFFEEDYLNFYDLQFLVTKPEKEKTEGDTEEEGAKQFPMIGYKKAGSTTISWSNNSKK